MVSNDFLQALCHYSNALSDHFARLHATVLLRAKAVILVDCIET